MKIKDLIPFCTNSAEVERLEAIDKHGSNNKAAKALNIARRTIDRTLLKVKARAASCGLDSSPTNNQVAKGYSTLLKFEDDDNNRVLQWVKTSKSVEQQNQEMQIAAKVFCEKLPKEEPKEYKVPNHMSYTEAYKNNIPFFIIGDAHIGMLAHDKEVGESFDLKQAEHLVLDAVTTLIDRAPLTERCVIEDVGDMTHYENYSATTEASGHALDFDSRFHKMIEVYTRVMRKIVQVALDKFDYVDVIICQGNHSRTNDHWMAVMLRALYENEPRLTVLPNESVFIPYRMGNTFVLAHHFDKCKADKLASVMANDFKQDWGETNYHYIDGGHVHSNHQKIEANGCVVESFNQVSTSDKYAHDAGWRSRKCMTMVLRSKVYGEIGRLTVPVEEVRDRIGKLKQGTSAKHRRKVYTV